MAKEKGERLLLWATTVAYVLIGLEVLFMITPFALYFYGVYGPVLEWLSSSRMTAWTTEFFLPHMVFVDDPLLNTLSYLQSLFVIGLALFFLAAAPLYFGRLTGRGVVSFGPYARLRHPQYLALAISGFGLLLYWPRFIVLIFFVTMLFVYYLLARNEEWRMKKEQPGSYEDYMARTWMFLPGEPGTALFAALFGWIKPKGLALTVCYLVVMMLSVAAAFGLRGYALEQLPKTEADGMQLVSVYPRPADRLESLYETAMTSPQVVDYLENHPTHLVYVMPGDFFLTGLILQEGPRFSEQMLDRYPHLRDAHKNRHSGDLAKFFRLGYKFFQTIGTTRRVYDYERLVFVETLTVDGEPTTGAESLQVGVTRLPALVVDIDAETDEILYVSEVSGNNAWGRLPMPNI
jgi:protein-S-isoprenylcysteine O-methyltransferase Ste14